MHTHDPAGGNGASGELMKRARATGIALVAVLCVLAVAPAGAAAPPGIFVPPTPRLTLNPQEGIQGTPTSITATQTVVGPLNPELTYPVGATPRPMTPGSNNTAVLTFDADDTTCGPTPVTVTWPAGPGASAGSDSAPFTLLCPAITLTPAAVYAPNQLTTVTVDYTDFEPNGDDFAKYLTGDGNPIGSYLFQQPISFTVSIGCGQHIVELTQKSQFGLLDAKATYTVNCPTVTLNPTTVARVTQPAPVDVEADQFPPDAPVTVTLNGAVVGSGTTDDNGTLSTTITTDERRCSTYTIAVSTNANAGNAGNATDPADPDSAANALPQARASAPLVVSCAAVIKADPDVVQAGMTTHITGAGFAPGSVVKLVWQLPDGTIEPVTGSPQKATSSETGSIDFFTLLQGQDEVGQRMLVATDGQLTASFKVFVEAGTMQPSGRSGLGIVIRR